MRHRPGDMLLSEAQRRRIDADFADLVGALKGCGVQLKSGGHSAACGVLITFATQDGKYSITLTEREYLADPYGCMENIRTTFRRAGISLT